MKLIKCENGHFYDGDKHSSCPHCSANSSQMPMEYRAPAPNNIQDGRTVDIMSMGRNEETTILTPDDAPINNVPVNNVPVNNVPVNNVPVNNVPVNNVPANNTFKFEQPVKNTEKAGDEKTVGLYDLPVNDVQKIEDPFANNSFSPAQPVPAQAAAPNAPAAGFITNAAPVIPAVNAAEKKKTGLCAGWVICVKGVNKGMDYRIVEGRNTVGRSEANDIALIGENTVSRDAHAYMVYEMQNNKFYVLPGLSKSLVYVNGEVLLEKREIEKNGIIELGNAQLMLIPACDDKFSWEMFAEE